MKSKSAGRTARGPSIRNIACMPIAFSPIGLAVRASLRVPALPGLAVATAMLAPFGASFAQQAPAAQPISPDELPEIVVTARKTKEREMDVPGEVSVLSGEKLEQMHATSFEDYAMLLPSVSFQSFGPGQSQVYMRGAVDGGDGNPSGSSPTVAVYLDETPVTAIGRNLDLHVYDLDRVEALPGPQSTLFGSSSEGGTLRMITHQPELNTFGVGVDLGGATTHHGGGSYSAEAFLNEPLGQKVAIRVVAYDVHDGGFVDNILGSRTYQLYQGNASGTNPTPTGVVTQSNVGLVKNAFNTEVTTGGRVALKAKLDANWTLNAGWINQKQTTNGIWADDAHTPGVGNYQIQSFFPNSTTDSYNQEHIGIEGDLGFADLLGTSSFSQRKYDLVSDYSEYSDFKANPGFAQFIGAASCDYYGLATTPCTGLGIYLTNNDRYRRQTNEIRLQSKGEGKLQYVLGLYRETFEHDYVERWIEPGAAVGGPDMAILGVSNLWYITQQSRVDSQWAGFGELRYSLSPMVTGTLGGRYFHSSSSLNGFSGYGLVAFSPLTLVNSSVGDSGSNFKADISYKPSADKHFYVLWSQGYRPGGINRVATSVVGPTYKSDKIDNFEAGWKSRVDRRIQFDGALYLMQWRNMQLSRYEAAWGAPLGLTVNLTQARILGLESSLAWKISQDWTLAATFDLNSAKLSRDLAVGSPTAGYSVAPSGTPLPYAPKIKYNISSRNTYSVGDFRGYFQASWADVGKRYNDVFVYSTSTLGIPGADNRRAMAAYGQLNLGAGISRDAWAADLYINNAMDRRAELARSTAVWDSWNTVNRPRTIGIKISYRYD